MALSAVFRLESAIGENRRESSNARRYTRCPEYVLCTYVLVPMCILIALWVVSTRKVICLSTFEASAQSPFIIEYTSMYITLDCSKYSYFHSLIFYRHYNLQHTSILVVCAENIDNIY